MHIHREMLLYQEIHTINTLDVALYLIRNVHEHITTDDLGFLIDENFVIPDDRKEIFKLGIMHGLNGDFYAALHLLIPQTENLFREFAKMCGGLVTVFEEDKTEQSKALYSIFESPELLECYNENILFTFRGLLNEKAGANLRNRIAHGITDKQEGNGVFGNRSVENSPCVESIATLPIFTSWLS